MAGRTLIEAPTSGVAGNDDACAFGGPDLGCERTPVERVEAHAAPPPTEEGERQRKKETALQRRPGGSREEHG